MTLDPIGFKIGLEVIAKAHYGKAIEVPYVFTDRVAGESKLNQREIFNYLKQLARLYAALAPAAARARSARPDADAGVAAGRAAPKRRKRTDARDVEQVPEVRRGALPARPGRKSLRLHSLRLSLSHERVRSHRVDRRRRVYRDRSATSSSGDPLGWSDKKTLSREAQKRSRTQRPLRIGRLRLCDDRRLSASHWA